MSVVVSVLCCQLEVSATSWSLVQGRPNDFGASLCVIETSWMRSQTSVNSFIVAPYISMIQSLLYTNLCTIYILSITKTLCSFDRSYMFRHIACHHQGAPLSWLKWLVKNIRS
jgi:hypothetical protein